jgi:AcrR family transcriptional regulator
MSTQTHAKLDLVKARSGGRSERVRDATMQAVRAILQEKGYAGVSHRAVATLANVDHVTVYRRWPTRARLVADMILELSDTFVPVPDSGHLRDDLEIYLSSIATALLNTDVRQMIQALLMASTEGDASVRAAASEIWRERFDRAFQMLDRAIERGEVPPDVDRVRVIEALVAPLWFRSFVSGLDINSTFVKQTAANALTLATITGD